MAVARKTITRTIVVAAITILTIVVFAYLDGRVGRLVCRYGKDGWLETNGFISCYRAP
jgi:hypothetical protein